MKGLANVATFEGITTIINSPFSEVGITFLKNGAPMASCRLTYQTVDKIDKAGLWNDRDFVGA